VVAVVADNWLIVCFASIFFNIFAFPCCYYLAMRICCRRCCLCTATEGQLIVAFFAKFVSPCCHLALQHTANQL